ncbi:MAG: HAMP domain-containing histidine kinase, partial [Planctomycetes bacterium]|nr:HAMP domain-containing histidine kinase [Planctomycetota bacterium]
PSLRRAPLLRIENGTSRGARDRRRCIDVTRTPSSILFGLILCLSLALVIWWTLFQAGASRELERAGARLAAGDLAGTAAAFGVADGEQLSHLGRTRFWMFTSEGAVFAIVLAISGGLYLASMRREGALRSAHDRFLAGATHELKTPLATISLLLESLRDDRLPQEKRARYLHMGLLEADRLERGITNVLVAAGLRTASGRDRQTHGDLAEDLRRAATELELRAAAADVDLVIEASEPVPMQRDAEAVQLILHNLMDNAIKYSSRGDTVTVTLTTEGDDARITVADTGRGMDRDELAHSFEPFWRGSDEAKGGSGLGLHLVRELTRAHHGEVAAASAGRDQGSTFVVRLPRRGGGR